MERIFKSEQALVLVDPQIDFIEGSLAVPGGKRIISNLNQLTQAYDDKGYPIVTTQDQHPKETAHFDRENPNFIDTWPAHCVVGTHGAELHPDLLVAKHHALARRFIKGTKACESPADDDSYTGALAYNPETGIYLPAWLKMHNIKKVTVAGYAIGDGDEKKLCVDSTAVDLQELGYEVSLVTDAVEEVLPENRAKCLKKLGERGIRLVTTEQVLEELGYAA